MKNLSKVFAALAMIATTGVATPSLDSKCNYTVATPLNGSNVLFDETCQIAYVMPPKKGIVAVENLTRTTNLQFCPAVKSVGETAKKTFNSMNILSGKIEEMVQAIELLNGIS